MAPIIYFLSFIIQEIIAHRSLPDGRISKCMLRRAYSQCTPCNVLATSVDVAEGCRQGEARSLLPLDVRPLVTCSRDVDTVVSFDLVIVPARVIVLEPLQIIQIINVANNCLVFEHVSYIFMTYDCSTCLRRKTA